MFKGHKAAINPLTFSCTAIWKAPLLACPAGIPLLPLRPSTALAGVAQWIDCQPCNQRVAGLIPSQGTCLGCGPGPQERTHKRHPHTDVLLLLFFPPFPSLKINTISNTPPPKKKPGTNHLFFIAISDFTSPNKSAQSYVSSQYFIHNHQIYCQFTVYHMLGPETKTMSLTPKSPVTHVLVLAWLTLHFAFVCFWNELQTPRPRITNYLIHFSFPVLKIMPTHSTWHRNACWIHWKTEFSFSLCRNYL